MLGETLLTIEDDDVCSSNAVFRDGQGTLQPPFLLSHCSVNCSYLQVFFFLNKILTIEDDDVEEINAPRPMIRPRPLDNGLPDTVPNPLSITLSDVGVCPDEVVANECAPSSSDDTFVCVGRFAPALISFKCAIRRPRPAIFLFCVSDNYHKSTSTNGKI